VSIGENAFWTCNNLTGITIPASVSSIGQGAFGACSGLTSVIFEGSGVKIANGVFDSAALSNAYKTGGAGTYTRTIGQQNWEKQ
ncbi:MAG: leucine-rich repeat domain-containing protein, partial [Spirochaetaceae bacterium]|nr:leucine-rich repeat domain-containing protein [Spirochaetaceae bacterium]